MGQCASCLADLSDAFFDPPHVLLVSTEDGSTVTKSKRDDSICPFQVTKGEGGTTKFTIDFSAASRMLRAGPHCTLATPKASPAGLTRIKDSTELQAVLKALWRSELFHGGEQLLCAITCTMTHADAENTDNKGPRVLVLTSLGRLFCINGTSTITTCHVTEIGSAEIQMRALTRRASSRDAASSSAGADAVPITKKSILILSFLSSSRQPWHVTTSAAAAQYLQVYLWLCNAVAHTHMLMRVNIAQPPMQLLPPLAADGSLHSAFVMQANAAGLVEPEDVLQKPDPGQTPAFLCLRRFTTKMEADVSAWSPKALPPLAEAMRFNTAMLAFKAKDAPHLGAHLGALGPMLTTNAKLIVLSLERVGGKPEAFVRMFKGLAANPASLLSVINLNGNNVGNEGGKELAAALSRLRPGLLAELHLRNCSIGGQGIASILAACVGSQQFNLLQLHLDGNKIDGPASGALAQILFSLPRIEQLSLAGTGASLASLGTLPPASLRQLRQVDLTGLSLAPELTALLHAAGPLFSSLKLSAGEMPARQTFLAALCARMAEQPELELEFSGGASAASASDFVADLTTALSQSHVCPAGLGFRAMDVSSEKLLNLLAGLHPGAHAVGQIQSLVLDNVVATTTSDVAVASLGKALAAHLKSPKGALAKLALVGTSNPSHGHAMILPILAVLPSTTSLEHLDISNQELGDANIVELGKALKVNKSITAVRFDGNGTSLHGLKALRLALNCNKRIVDFPLPDKDIDVALKQAAQAYQSSLHEELEARRLMKSAFGRGGYVNWDTKQRALDGIKLAKAHQRAATGLKDKVRTFAADIQSGVMRNQEVAQIKGGRRAGKAEAKLAAQAAKAADKATAKAEAKRETQKMKLWKRRHTLIPKWRKAVQQAVKEKQFDVAWFTTWAKGWGKPYLTPKALHELWRAIPHEQKEHFEPLRDQMRAAFAQEEDMDAQVEAMLQEARQAQAQKAFHDKEVQYHQMMSARDPRSLYTPQVDSGARKSSPPSKWELDIAASRPPPADFNWQPSGPPRLNAGAGARPPPMISYPPPNATDAAVLMGSIVLTNAKGAPMGVPSVSPPPTAVGQPTGVTVTFHQPGFAPPPFMPYPTAPGPQSVYTVSTGVPVRPSEPVFTPPPVFIPPPASPPVQMQVQCPPGMGPGMPLMIQANGANLQPAPVYSLPPTKTYHYRNAGRRSDHRSDNAYYDSRRDDDYLLLGYGGLGAYHSYNSFERDHYTMYHRPHHYHHYSHHNNDCYYYEDYYRDDNYAADQDLYDPVGDSYGEETVIEYDENDIDFEIDEAVDMYGSAGPQDLPDGGRGPGKSVDPLSTGRAAHEKRKADLPNRGRDTVRSVTVRSVDSLAAGRAAQEKREAEARFALAEMTRCPVDWIDQLWRKLVTEAEASVLGCMSPLMHPSAPRILAPRGTGTPHSANSVTLVTQCSVDRLERLAEQLTSWRGPASVALYIDAARGSEAAKQMEAAALFKLHELLQGESAAAEQLTLSLLYRAEEDVPEAGLYPVNSLRNLALAHATTDLVFLLDVDFVPSQGLLRELMHDETTNESASQLHRLRTTRTALVLPAFEVVPEHRLPKQQASLAALLTGCSPPAATPFHCAHFAAGHGPTDFPRWLTASAPYAVEYAEYFEPYIIASRTWLPKYDEAFRGYGMNKVAHLYAVASAGAAMVVQPRHFVAAHEHDKSASWQQVFGTDADPRQKMRVAAIYRRVKEQMPMPPLLALGGAPKVSQLVRETKPLAGGVHKRAAADAEDGYGSWVVKRARCAPAAKPMSAVDAIVCRA